MTQPMPSPPDQPHASEIGYIMRGYPRLSDVFINSEIHLLESMGLTLQIFSAKKPESGKRHSIVDNIQATLTYLPEVTSISAQPFILWLYRNGPQFLSSHARLCRSNVRRYCKTLFEAVGMSVKYRSTFMSSP